MKKSFSISLELNFSEYTTILLINRQKNGVHLNSETKGNKVATKAVYYNIIWKELSSINHFVNPNNISHEKN